MGDKEDYLTSYREFFENFAATVNPEDQLPVNIAGYTITEAELPGEVLYWTTQYLTEKQCPLTLMTPLRRIILDEVQVASKKQPNEFGYKSDESVYIALRLMQAVTARVNDVCLRYLDNSRLDSLPPPPPPELRELQTVSIATKNSRRVMEDRHVEIGNLEALFGIETTEPTSFYAVYDGHAGSAAAMYCAAHVHQYLVESPHYKTDLRRALRDAFLRTDADFVRKSNQERACGGSTAVAVALRGRRLLAAWAGDSLALLAKRMRLMQLVRAHKPGRQDERDRIEQSGGTVMFWGTWRVNGQLAVSRAIGDAQYKPYVTARPETTTVDLDGDEDFVVVACDGLWDFVSEDDVALTVYRQIAADPDDLKAVTKRLVVLAKRQGSADNISIIVVFLKDPREIAADNCPPMDLGLDNALANAPPFVMEAEACKRLDGAVAEAEAECADGEPDNGVDNSDSDSEDLGPETAVDADDLDSEARLHPQPPTPPAHAVEENHVDGGLVDNVAESGEDSEDEWNYFKGEGETDGGRREDTPCQDNSAWETSSVDMNSSPLNPDAPPFVPGVAGDVVLAESPRKPLPMDDAELPDVAQFSTEARMHPNELLDLDNCDQLNGHHNVSLEEATKEQLNGNEKGPVDSLGFGFGADQPALIHDLQRVQHDTMDFCNIQVFQTHNETNPFASDGNDELFERLKNKERDPMSMSFYQEKDDDTCERLAPVDLNAVQPLPDSDDEDIAERTDFLANKENQQPQPDNDLLRFAEPSAPVAAPTPPFGDNFASNIHAYSDLDFQPTQPAEAPHTDTPESHKLLFEQIPEIPDGKSSELGFSNDDALDPSESDRDARATPQDETSQDVDMESKLDDSPSEELQPKMTPEPIEHEYEASQAPVDNVVNEMREIIAESEIKQSQEEISVPEPALSPRAPPAALTPEHDVQHNIVVDVHHNHFTQDEFQDEKLDFEERLHGDVPETEMDVPVPEIQFETQSALTAESPLPSKSPLPTHSPFPSESPVPPSESPAPLHSESPAALHSESPAALQSESPAPLQRESPALSAPLQSESPAPIAPLQSESPAPTAPLQSESPAPSAPLQSESPVPSAPLQSESPVPVHSPVEECKLQPGLSPAPQPSPAPSPLPAASELAPSPLPTEELRTESPAPADVPLPRESPLPQEAAPSPADLRPDTASPATASPLPPAPLAASPPPAADARLSPQPQEAHVPEPSGPAPDIVPEEPPRSDLVTDIDIGIPESRAQEICVPVTSELLEPADSAPAQPPLSDTPIAADAASADELAGADALPAAAVVAAAAAVAATAATAAAVTKAKASPATKKSPTTPKAATPAKSAPKTSTTSKTPVSAKKLATPTTPAAKAPAAAKTTPARTPLSASKPAPAKTTPSVAKTTPAAAKTTPAARTTPAKPSAPAAKPAPAKTSLTTKVPTAPKPASASAKPAVKEATAVAKSAPTTRTAPAARPAPKLAAPRPATAGARPAASTASSAPRPASARPAPRPAPAAAAPRPKPLEKKPLTNGDVKPAAAKPAPRPAPIARPAPRPTPRAAPAAPTQPKSAAPLPAPRRAGGKDADKASKDLANKRITSKAAPPRTANTKVSALSKNNAPKPIKKPPAAEPCAPPPAPAPLENGAPLANGDSLPLKAPPSPPADSALLPDVIA